MQVRSTNKAKRDKSSILADTKNLLGVLLPAIQRMPKIDRIEGAPVEMKRAAFDVIRHLSIALTCQEVREENIRLMIGDCGVMFAIFEILIRQGLLTSSTQLEIARHLEKIDEGISKWRSSMRKTDSASGA